MLYPSPLHNGATIGLIAPCSPLSQERLLQCIQSITSLGYEVALGKSARASLHGYLAGSDEMRANDINSMFLDSSIDAIFCIRGGYGSTRIMRLLDYKMIQKHPKIFVGYSDVTSFHLAFYQCSHLATFHGPMVSSNIVDDFDPYTSSSFFKALRIPPCLSFHNPNHNPFLPIVEGKARGRVIGGCLSLVAPSIGTFYQPDFKNTILFLEDVEESLPRCDKLMQQLKNTCILSKVNGILLGNFKDCYNPNEPDYSMYDFFCEFFKDYDKPVLWGVQSGHDKPMGTIPFGTICSMDSTSKTLAFHYH